MNKFFDCVNGKQEAGEEVRNPDLAAYFETNDPRLFLTETFLEYFAEWKREIQDGPGIFSATEKAQMIISYQALEPLQITVKSIVGVIKYMLEVANAPRCNARLPKPRPIGTIFWKGQATAGRQSKPDSKSHS